jgi:hypothetical protein
LDPEEEQRVENEMEINGFAIVGNCQTSTPFQFEVITTAKNSQTESSILHGKLVTSIS